MYFTRWIFPARRLVVAMGCSMAVIMVLYGLSFLVIFDITKPARSWDEDNFSGQEVALGPRPRAIFEGPSHWGTAYDERQWPFRIYRPLCRVWVRMMGYAPPIEWRQ
jgi:hypothetical protein